MTFNMTVNTGKLEPLGTLAVGGLLMLTGLGVGYAGIVSAIDMASLPLPDIAQFTGSAGSPSETSAPVGPSFVTGDHGVIGDLLSEAKSPLSEVKGANVSMIGNEAAIGISMLSIFSKEMLFHYTLKAGAMRQRPLQSSSEMYTLITHLIDKLYVHLIYEHRFNR